jgi:hypothetical protein
VKPCCPYIREIVIAALHDSIGGSVPRPVEEDARGLAAKARIALGRPEVDGVDRGLTCLRHLHRLRALPACGAGPSRVRRLLLARDAADARIREQHLHRRPVAGDIELAVREPERALAFVERQLGGPGQLVGADLGVAVVAPAVLECDVAEIARARIGAVRQGKHRDRLAVDEHLGRPARAPQHGGRAQLATPVLLIAGFARHREVQPRMRIDDCDVGHDAGERHQFRRVVEAAETVMRLDGTADGERSAQNNRESFRLKHDLPLFERLDPQ